MSTQVTKNAPAFTEPFVDEPAPLRMLTVRVTREEYAAIKLSAAAVGVSMNKFCKEQILLGSITVDEYRKLTLPDRHN